MSIKYQMWLTYNAEKEKIQLPVLPTSFQIKNGSNNDSVNIAGLGEIVVIQNRPALQFSFSSFFPATKFPGIQVNSITKPLSLIQKINSWKASNKPIHFIVTACGINLYTSIENFNYSEEGGDPGTYQYSLTLKEYKAIKVRQVKVDLSNATASVKKEQPRVDNTVKPRTYTVVVGDCLWSIAQRIYGDGSKYVDIRNANPSIFVNRCPRNLIFAGDILIIP